MANLTTDLISVRTVDMPGSPDTELEPRHRHRCAA